MSELIVNGYQRLKLIVIVVVDRQRLSTAQIDRDCPAV
jgi:hypothetical protein